MKLAFDKSVNFRGNPVRAIDFAAGVLTQANFELVVKTDTRLEAVNPRGWQRHWEPLLGISEIEMNATGGLLSVKGRAGNVKKLIRATALFLFLLGSGLGVMFTIMFHSPWFLLSGFAPLIPWPVILPLIYSHFRKESLRALDLLLNNAAKTAA